MSKERLDLQKKRLALTEKLTEARLTAYTSSPLRGERDGERGPSPSTQSDQFGPLAKNWEDVSERVRIGLGISKEEAARRAELRRLRRAQSSLNPNLNLTPNLNPTPSPAAQTISLRSLADPEYNVADPATDSPTSHSRSSTALNLIDLLTAITPGFPARAENTQPQLVTNENLQSKIINHQSTPSLANPEQNITDPATVSPTSDMRPSTALNLIDLLNDTLGDLAIPSQPARPPMNNQRQLVTNQNLQSKIINQQSTPSLIPNY
jgi:hypothetical protein